MFRPAIDMAKLEDFITTPIETPIHTMTSDEIKEGVARVRHALETESIAVFNVLNDDVMNPGSFLLADLAEKMAKEGAENCLEVLVDNHLADLIDNWAYNAYDLDRIVESIPNRRVVIAEAVAANDDHLAKMAKNTPCTLAEITDKVRGLLTAAPTMQR